MGKKVEKALKGAGGPASANSRGDDGSTPEPYCCTGHFPDDFLELWQRAGYDKEYAPVVKQRAKPPGAPDETKTVQQEEEAEHAEEEPLPTTYTAVHKFAFFRPSIQADFEVEDTKQLQINHPQQFYIRGWKLEEKVINVLKLCLLEKLTALNLWHVGLTDHTFQAIVTFLSSLANVKTVIIEGNPIPEEPWHKLFSDDLSLQHVSLRNNEITDAGVEKIGKCLGSVTSQNRILLSLNLAFNRISDKGAEHIATGLRMNRTLLSLSLASNSISDLGAQAIASSLQWFTLTHEEVIHRRKFLSQQGFYGRGSSAPGSRRGDSKDRPGSNRSGSQVDKTRASRGSSKKKPDTGKVPEKTPKKDDAKGKKGDLPRITSKASVVSETPKNKGRKSGGAGGKDGKRGALEVESLDAVEHTHPFQDTRIEHKQGKVFIPGCFTLVNLNLSRNCIGEHGMKSLLKAMKHQLKQKDRGITSASIPGLLKLSLQKNDVRQSSPTYLELLQIMLDRDPIKPETKSPDLEQLSAAG